jgi:hypothetical protein
MFASLKNWKRIWVALATLALAIGLSCGPSNAANSKTSSAELVFRGELNRTTFQKAARDDRAVRIVYSPGGTGAAAMALAEIKHLVIDGPCQSACAWAFVINSEACFTPRAVFSFHAAHDPGTGKRIPTATQYWIDLVTPSLRPALAGLKTSSDMIRVTAKAMHEHYEERACDANGIKPHHDAAVLMAVAPVTPVVVVEVAHIESAATPRVNLEASPVTALAASITLQIGQVAATETVLAQTAPTYLTAALADLEIVPHDVAITPEIAALLPFQELATRNTSDNLLASHLKHHFTVEPSSLKNVVWVAVSSAPSPGKNDPGEHDATNDTKQRTPPSNPKPHQPAGVALCVRAWEHEA